MEIQEVAAEDMNIILKYIYGTLDALPEERLHHLVLAADRLQACYPAAPRLTGIILWIGTGKVLASVGTHQWALRKDVTWLILNDSLTHVFADDAIDGALRFPVETSLQSGHICGDSDSCRQSESSGPARGLCGVCSAGEEQVCSPCLSSMMRLALTQQQP